jgi:tRNA(Ile)-lysidine synthase
MAGGVEDESASGGTADIKGQDVGHQLFVARGSATRLGVAVSGGADSVYLLHWAVERGRAAAVLHVNHQLRGAESDADEEFVRGLAREFGLPVYVLKEEVSGGNVEQEARRARYRFFEEQIAAGVCEAVATGHTLDDQAETVLYRFLRGAGTAGLSGIRPATANGMIRPLLGMRREEIRTWLRNRNIQWQEDRSNEKLEFARNRIRLRLMPELVQTLNPALPQVLATTALWAQGEEDYWASEIDRLAAVHLIQTSETVLISIRPFIQLPVAAQRRLLRAAIESVRHSLRSIDFAHIEAIRGMMATLEGSGRIQLPDLDIYRSFDWLRLAPVGFDSRLERDFESALEVPGRTELHNRQLTIEMELVSCLDVYNNDVNALDWGRCSGALKLRNWRPGDQYQPKGRSSAVKIKTLFQEARIPLWERRHWPVIVGNDGEILWSRRFGVVSRWAAGSESRAILLIREQQQNQKGAGQRLC